MESRRSFLKLSATGLLTLPFLSQCAERKKITHIVSISFDDGFARSFIKTAEIYEKYDLQACFNVMASGGQSDFKPPDDYIQPGILGDFELWNELKRRGHEIMPHGYKHANLAHLEFSEACDLIQRSLDSFAENLIDFDAQ